MNKICIFKCISFNDLNFALSILKTNNYEFDEFKISQGCCYSINN